MRTLLLCVVAALLVHAEPGPGGVYEGKEERLGGKGMDVVDEDEDVMYQNVEVKELTDADFEYLTQASTGMTTGDWLIMFHAPWCGFCRRLSGDWEKVARGLHERAVVAKMDATVHFQTATRFDVISFPTIILLSKGKMYKHSGGRSVESLIDFALNPDSDKVEPQPIPAPMGFLGSYVHMFVRDFQV